MSNTEDKLRSSSRGLKGLQSLQWNRYPNLVALEPNLELLSAEVAERMLYQLCLIRSLEEWLIKHESLVHGPVHASIGQEAVAVGAMFSLERRDQITSTHRAHHHVLARLVASAEHDCGGFRASDSQPTPAPVVEALLRLLAEILGLRQGLAGGRGGSMHLGCIEAGVLGTSAIVGGGIPIATGAGLAFAKRGSGNVSVAFFGDGAASIGALHEAMAMARVLALPVVFVVENNLYSVATSVAETVGFPDIAIRAAGHDMAGVIVDGMDPVSVATAMAVAREHAVSNGPVLIEAKTYRYLHQSGGLRGSAYGYRTREEEAHWQARDPVTVFPERLAAMGVLEEDAVTRIQARAMHDVASVAMELVEEGPNPRVRPDAQPLRSDALRGVRATTEPKPAREPLPAGETVTYQRAISMVISRSMERDPEVYVIGEEVGHLKGGAYGATRDACRSFPDRVISAPIAENGFCGLALGSAMMGMRPIVELMFPDFALEAADQLFNHIPKTRHMFGGDVDVPLVVRTRTAQGRGYGPQHSSDPAALFALFPGWRIVAPSTPMDYVGLFNSAISGKDPVLIIEHHQLWTLEGPIPSLDECIPFGVARVVRPGSDVTVLTWSHPTHRSVRVADRLASEGIQTEVIDLRTIDPANVDWSTIDESIRRTGAAVVVEDASYSHSLGPRLAQVIHERHFEHLRVPVRLATGRDVPTPVSRTLEEFVLLSDEDIAFAIRASCGRVASRENEE